MGQRGGGRRVAALALLTALALTACSDSGGLPDVPPTVGPDVSSTVPAISDPAAEVLQSDRDVPVAPRASWTVLVYLDARNQLESFGAKALDQIAALTGTAGKVNVVVLAGRTGSFSADRGGGLAAFDSVRLLVPDDAGGLSELADFGTVPMGRPGALREFVTNGIRLFPADRYGLVLWGAGAGWNGFGLDQSGDQPELLSLGDVAGELSGALSATGQPRLALVAFDASLMATFETAAALEPVADIMVASQQPLGGNGLDLAVLQVLADQPSTDGLTLGTRLVDAARIDGGLPQPDAASAVMDLRSMAGLADALDQWVTSVRGVLPALAPVLGRARRRTMSFGSSPNPARDTGLVDLGGFVKLVSELDGTADVAVSDAGRRLTDALGLVVSHTVVGSARSQASGLSIYFPSSPQAAATAYAQVTSARSWRTLVADYLTAGRSIEAGAVPRFTAADRAATVAVGSDTAATVTATGTLESGSLPLLVGASMLTGVVGSPTVWIGDRPADLSASSGVVSGVWDRSTLDLVVGDVRVPGYLSWPTTSGTSVLFDVPLAYTDGAATVDAMLELVLDGGTKIVSSRLYRLDPQGTWGELVPSIGSSLAAQLQRSTPSGGVEWFTDTTRLSTAAPIEAGLGLRAPDAALQVRLIATDHGGNSDYVEGVTRSTVQSADVTPTTVLDPTAPTSSLAPA